MATMLAGRGKRSPSLLEHLPQYLEHLGHGRAGQRTESVSEALAIDRAQLIEHDVAALSGEPARHAKG